VADDFFQFLAIHVTVPSHDLVGQALFFDPKAGHLKAMIFKEATTLDTLGVIVGAGTEIFDGHTKALLWVGRLQLLQKLATIALSPAGGFNCQVENVDSFLVKNEIRKTDELIAVV